MECNGTNVPVTLEAIRDGYGDNTVVWRPKVPSGGEVGTAYSVSVSNIWVAGQARNVNYAVAVIDPDELKLSATRISEDSLLLSWLAAAQPYGVQEATSLGNAADWNLLPVSPLLTNGTYTVTVPLAGQARFYRLRRL